MERTTSFHVIVTSHKNLFTTYKPEDHDDVKIGNTSFSSFIGIGDVHLKTNIGCILVFDRCSTLLNVTWELNTRLDPTEWTEET